LALFCDESGGISAGAMIFAAVSITAEAADAVIGRFRAITGLRGELKGSRITSTERGLLFEILWQHDARAWVAIADGDVLNNWQQLGGSDMALYARLLDTAVAAWIPASGGVCADVVIDEGRYDARILNRVRGDIQALLGNWGHASLVDSRRCSGVQIADVIANSIYNVTIKSARAARTNMILAPSLASGRLCTISVPEN